MNEMACISNYTGLIPDIRGMHGPVAGVNEISKLFRPKSEGGILNHRGVVDYARPLKHSDGSIDFDRSVTPGVFLCVYRRHFDQTRSSQRDRDFAFGARARVFVLRRAAAWRPFLRPVFFNGSILIVAVGLSVYAARRRQRAATATKPGAS